MTCPYCSTPVGRDHFCLQMLGGMPIGERIGRRVVCIGDAERTRAKELLAYAARFPYRPGLTAVPGGMPEYVMVVPFGIRCVYSITEDAGPVISTQRFRDLSMDLPKSPELPQIVRILQVL